MTQCLLVFRLSANIPYISAASKSNASCSKVHEIFDDGVDCRLPLVLIILIFFNYFGFQDKFEVSVSEMGLYSHM